MADYSPQQDPTIPCADAGMIFRKGDILEIVDQTDALWWQAKKLPSNTACAGLIPSTNLLKRSGKFTKLSFWNLLWYFYVLQIPVAALFCLLVWLLLLKLLIELLMVPVGLI